MLLDKIDKDPPIRYLIPNSNQVLELTPSVLHTFKIFRQTQMQPEAGGLLFAEFYLPMIKVKEISGPHTQDKRGRYSFIPCRDNQRKLISQRFNMNLHFIGEWHTHPENDPSPSSLDLNSMHDSFINSKHELNFFVMIIVGSYNSNLRLWVSLHNREGYIKLEKEEIHLMPK